VDPELAAKINELGTWESGGEGEKYSALTVEFRRRGGDLYVRVSDDVGRRVEHRLKELRELYSAQRERPRTSWGDERYHPLLSTIEAAISRFYREHPELMDGQVLLVLDGLIQDLEREGEDPLRTLIRDSLRFQLSVAEWSREEVLGCPRKVRRSVERHQKRGGTRGYLDSIVQFL